MDQAAAMPLDEPLDEYNLHASLLSLSCVARRGSWLTSNLKMQEKVRGEVDVVDLGVEGRSPRCSGAMLVSHANASDVVPSQQTRAPEDRGVPSVANGGRVLAREVLTSHLPPHVARAN